ncbi:MAG: hypothetical protein HY391_06400 [Deltaproteobacteria bacterium]|nr:hypothetical protein [Deltaproteobacteria bacterium]
MRNSHKCFSYCQSQEQALILALSLFLVILLLKSGSLDAAEKWKPRIVPKPLITSVDYAGHPEIALSGAEVAVLWEEREEGRYAIWERRSLNGGQTWEGAEKVSPQEVPSARFPRLAANSEGLFLLVWKRAGERGGRDALYYQLRRKGEKSWSPPKRLTNELYGPVRFFSLTSSESNFALTWSGFNSEKGFGIYFQKWREPKSSACLERDNRIAGSPKSGTFLGKRTGSSGGLLPGVRSSGEAADQSAWGEVVRGGGGSGWSSPERLSESETLERPADFPVVAVRGEEIAVAWQDLRRDLTPLRDPIPDDWRVVLKYSRDSGETWSEEIEISRDFHFAFRPSLAWDNQGSIVVLWRNKDQRISWHYRRTDLNLQTGEAIQKGRVPFPHSYVDGLRLFQHGKRLFSCWFSPSHGDRSVVLACGGLQGKSHLLLKGAPLQGYPSLAIAGNTLLMTWAEGSIYMGGWEIE